MKINYIEMTEQEAIEYYYRWKEDYRNGQEIFFNTIRPILVQNQNNHSGFRVSPREENEYYRNRFSRVNEILLEMEGIQKERINNNK